MREGVTDNFSTYSFMDGRPTKGGGCFWHHETYETLCYYCSISRALGCSKNAYVHYCRQRKTSSMLKHCKAALNSNLDNNIFNTFPDIGDPGLVAPPEPFRGSVAEAGRVQMIYDKQGTMLCIYIFSKLSLAPSLLFGQTERTCFFKEYNVSKFQFLSFHIPYKDRIKRTADQFLSI